MNFDWLKKIFKNNKSNKSISDLAIIDTSFIRVPKLSKLSKEEKEKVLTYYNNLVLDNDIDLIKYSDDLLEKANTEKEMLLRAMARYEEQYKEQNQVPIIEIYHLGKLSSIEYGIIEKNIMNIRKELELKLLALDMYIKKEEKRKYDFLGVFGKAEKIKYFTDKNKLLSERERLLTSIKIDDNILTTVRKDIKENQRLIVYHDLLDRLQKDNNTKKLREYLNDSMCELSEKSFFSIRDEYEEEVENEVGHKMKGCPINDFKKGSCGRFYIISSKISEDNQIIDDKLINYVFEKIRDNKNFSWVDFLLIVPDEFLNQLYEIVAKYLHKRDLYVFEHKNDYKNYLQDMKNLISNYETNSKKEWDVKLLEEKVKFYTERLKKYLNIYGNTRSSLFSESYDDQISPVIEEQLKKYYYKLLFLYTISKGYDNSILELLSNSYYDEGSYLNIENIYTEFYIFLNELSVDVYNKYKIMPKNDIYSKEELGHFRIDESNIRYIINQGDFLYKLLNGDYDNTKIHVCDDGVYTRYHRNTSIKNIVDYLNKSLHKYNVSRNILNETYYIDKNEHIFIEDIFYIFHILGIKDNKMIDNLIKGSSYNDSLITNIRMNKIEKEYDDRIYILPNQIKFNQLLSFQYKPVINSFDKLNISDTNIAIYVSNWGQVNAIHRLLEKNETNIKYLIMKESLYESYKEVHKYPNIIIVPDDTKYNELSLYLDEKITKEKEQYKVLCKKK